MKHFKSILAMVLALVMVLSCVGTAFAADKEISKDISGKTPITSISKENKKEAKNEELKGFKSESFKELNTYQYADDEIVRAIILLEGKPEADVAEAGSEKAASHRVKLINQHNAVRKAMAGISYEMQYEFTRLLNGFSCDVAYGDLEAIAAIEGVEAVHIANHFEAPEFEVEKDDKQMISNQITGNSSMIADEWDGYGIVVAVLDTGLNTTHEAFQDVAGYAEEYGVLTKEAVEAADLYADGAYLSAKVPFAYDYAEGDADVTDYSGHGTHVSGTAVGMAATVAEDGESLNVTFCGSAPAAQLLSMKIFKDAEGGTTSDIYFYALEDAYTLGADVVNMSIGSPGGFTYDASLETEVFGNIYKRMSDAGIIMSVAAGNEYSMSYFASVYEGYTGAIGMEYTDYGTVATPSTYEGNISVASMENYAYPDYVITIGEESVSFVDSCTDGTHGWVDTFGGTEQDYVIVTNAEGKISLGVAADFENVDVKGKIAIVSRGEINFEDKVENAANAGAIGCIVVNNEEGIISMAIETFEIPAISLQQSALEVLANDTTGKIGIPDSMTYVPNPNALLMSDFSNWGTSPMLTLDPTITSIGGMIYSSVPGADDAYEVYSGTSMAAPNASGTYANLLSAIYENNPELSKVEAAELAKDLIYSSATILTDADGYIYSPRKQGAGLASSYEGIWSNMESAYITDPIKELGDDPEKTGVYEFSVTLKNEGDYDLTYSDFEAYVMYDYPVNAGTAEEPKLINTLTSEYAYYMNDEATAEYGASEADVSYSIDGVEISEFALAMGEEITIDVKITLSAGMKAFFDAYYPNGGFVEGYVVFNDVFEEEVFYSPHATFLAYYGDWTQGDVLEEADFRDIVEAELWLNTTVVDAAGNTYGDYSYTYANSGILNFYTHPNIAYITDAEITTAYAYAGDNLLGYTDYYDEHISFSTPLTNGTYNYAETIYMAPYQLRNVNHLIMTVSNKETGEIYYVDDTQYLPKAIYDSEAGWSNTGLFIWDGKDAKGEYVPSGTVATITYDAVLPYGEAEQNDIWGFDVTVDYTAPTLDSIVFDEEAKTLTVTATDENYLQSIYLADSSYNILDTAIFSSDVKGETFTATFDVSGYIEDGELAVYVVAIDYATNEMEQEVFFFETDLDATVTLITPYGTEVIECKTSDRITFEAAETPEHYEFMFWSPAEVEKAVGNEIWDVPAPWYFEGDTMLVSEQEYTFYALYAAIETVPLEKANYYMDYDVDYSGDWAICGWNLDSEYNFITEDPLALDCNGETIRVTDLEDAEIGTEHVEFYTDGQSIRYTFEAVGEEVYTIKSVSNGKYLAADEELDIKFVDEVTENATWKVTSAGTGFSSVVYNAGVTDAVLVYDDEAQKFALYNDNKPYYGDYFPSEWFYLVLYRCADEEEVADHYTTKPCVHANTEIRNAVDATYTDNGYTGDTYCVDCGKLIAEGEVIEAIGNRSGDCYFDDFSDCDAEWYHEPVDFAVSNDLMKGVGNGKFNPNGTLTRAMVVTVLYRAAGSPEVAEASTFTDVPADKWYSDAIAWAQANGVVKGVSETSFAPDAEVTREQIAAILWRYLGEPEATADLSAFVDADDISAYAVDAVTWAVSADIFRGDDTGALLPIDNATRAQFACIIMRYLEGSYDCANLD